MVEYIVEVSSIDDFGGFYRADPKQVVRCRDCKEFDCIQDDRVIIYFCRRGGVMKTCDPYGFCAWGERRNGR